MKPDTRLGDLLRFIDLLNARANEGATTVSEQRGEDGTKELFLTIENTVEDRVRAYTRLLRKKQVLRKSRG